MSERPPRIPVLKFDGPCAPWPGRAWTTLSGCGGTWSGAPGAAAANFCWLKASFCFCYSSSSLLYSSILFLCTSLSEGVDCPGKEFGASGGKKEVGAACGKLLCEGGIAPASGGGIWNYGWEPWWPNWPPCWASAAGGGIESSPPGGSISRAPGVAVASPMFICCISSRLYSSRFRYNISWNFGSSW